MSTEVLDRDAPEIEATAASAIVDCDIHPRAKSRKESFYPYLDRRWQELVETFGARPKIGNLHGRAFAKSQPAASRRDAWPPSGGPPGSDLEFLKHQLLDSYNIGLGILNFAGENGQGFQNLELGAAYTHAINDWLKWDWTAREPRLKASIVVPYEYPEAAVAEIESRAGDPDFIQILLHSRSAEPFGRRRYWPIFEAASRVGLPVGIHAFGYGGNPITSGGWPSFYLEEMVNHSQTCQALLTSLVLEGVFEMFPSLKLVLMESGFGWVPSLCWRLDKLHDKLPQETVRLRRRPSEYIRQQVWFTTQPMEEPTNRRHLLETIDLIGWDRLLFSTDYPHWDFDDPGRAFPVPLSPEQRRQVFRTNALEVYGQTL